ncbi:MAG: GDP-mannose 4,6-dehydratase [Phycisphaerales bacterium]|nr:GDP-mannose 4,6-dehydratase [Phycisphaerales bacterium]
MTTPAATTPPSAAASGGKTALITGITGQDGSYLAELLIAKGYSVHGIVRRASLFNTARVDHLYLDPHERPSPGRGTMTLHHGDITDASCLERLVRTVGPDEVYNLAAQSHVRVSFEQPIYTAETVAMGAVKLLEAVRDYQQVSGRRVRYYQASSSEMFGAAPPPQDEQTPFRPRSPYAVAKVMAHQASVNYREAYGMHVSCGILFNHESPRRGETFVTRKITRAVGRIKHGLQDAVYLGNLDARRDWGFAGDYAKAMWLMLQQETPGDFVIATGRSISVRRFAELAFARAGLEMDRHVQIDKRYLRPAEVDALEGDASRARAALGWKPETSVERLVEMMVDADVELGRQEAMVRGAGPARGVPTGGPHAS